MYGTIFVNKGRAELLKKHFILKSVLKFKIPFYYLLVSIILGITITYFVFQGYGKKLEQYKSEITLANSINKNCDYDFARLPGYKHIKPLVWVRPSCESQRYSDIKGQLSELIRGYVNSGVLYSASFDLRDLKNGDWVSYNSEEKYSPGSLMKVPVMITILHMAENNPGLLDREVVFNQIFQRNFAPNFNDALIKLGEKYTIRQLLKRMIQYSDNDAADLLCQNIDTVAFKKTFTDFGFKAGNLREIYPISSVEFSAYMEMLYNAGYLTITDSEYAMDLLTTSNFKQGLVSGLPNQLVT